MWRRGRQTGKAKQDEIDDVREEVSRDFKVWVEGFGDPRWH